MDLKFRSDLLGRSVLFIGYSFRDINIRVIWFKLMRMMKDIRPEDRPTSYIVRFDRNPVLQRLYDEVGIKTIALDPKGLADSSASRTALLSEFLLELSIRTSHNGAIPGTTTPQFISTALISNLSKALEVQEKMPQRSALFSRGVDPRPGGLESLISIIANRTIPASLKSQLFNILDRLAVPLRVNLFSKELAIFAVRYSQSFGATAPVTYISARSIMRMQTREALFAAQPSWDVIWNGKISIKQADSLISFLNNDLDQFEETHQADYDIAYGIDVVGRIANGEIFDHTSSAETVKAAKDVLDKAEKLLPTVQEYDPPSGEAPDLDAVVAVIDGQSIQEDEDDDIPF